MGRSKHPKRAIEEAIQYAESKGWRYKETGESSHAWGRLYCSERSREGCKVSVWSTPRVPEDHAGQIRREVNQCPHGAGPKK